VKRQELVELGLDLQDLAGVDLDVGGLALKTAQGLVDHHAGIGQAVALALGACREQEGAHARRLTDAQGAHVGLDKLHRVVDGHARRDRTARGVDVEVDVLVRVLGFEKEELRDDEARDRIVDGADEKDHALLEQARVDVVGPLAAAALLHHHRHEAEPERGVRLKGLFHGSSRRNSFNRS
jgi:hypothetical protein